MHTQTAKLSQTNTHTQVVANKSLSNIFEFAVMEQCFETGECGKARAFMDAGKPIFDHEYMFSSTGVYTLMPTYALILIYMHA